MRHAPQEITAKLSEAAGLAAAGKTQTEIAGTLGISVMTYHRWRNARAQRDARATPAEPTGSLSPVTPDRVAELQLENERLKKLVISLLLEKAKLEECAVRQLTRLLTLMWSKACWR